MCFRYGTIVHPVVGFPCFPTTLPMCNEIKVVIRKYMEIYYLRHTLKTSKRPPLTNFYILGLGHNSHISGVRKTGWWSNKINISGNKIQKKQNTRET